MESKHNTRALIDTVVVPIEYSGEMERQLWRWTAKTELIAGTDPKLTAWVLHNPLPLEWVEHSMHEIGLLCQAKERLAKGVKP